jgi:hypothetical protein
MTSLVILVAIPNGHRCVKPWEGRKCNTRNVHCNSLAGLAALLCEPTYLGSKNYTSTDMTPLAGVDRTLPPAPAPPRTQGNPKEGSIRLLLQILYRIYMQFDMQFPYIIAIYNAINQSID